MPPWLCNSWSGWQRLCQSCISICGFPCWFLPSPPLSFIGIYLLLCHLLTSNNPKSIQHLITGGSELMHLELAMSPPLGSHPFLSSKPQPPRSRDGIVHFRSCPWSFSFPNLASQNNSLSIIYTLWTLFIFLVQLQHHENVPPVPHSSNARLP